MLLKHTAVMVGSFLITFVYLADCRLAECQTAALVEKVQSAVVRISAFDVLGKEVVQGSGFFVSQEGHVITNWHVISSAASVAVKTTTGATFAGLGVIAKDEGLDLAKIAIDARNTKFRKLPLAATLPKVGERVIVLGSPFGLETTISDGLISGLRKPSANKQILQISAPISPGSSGGPVINMKGQVVGIASFQLAKGQNLNFAVPAVYAGKLGEGPSYAPFANAESKKAGYLSRINHDVQLRENGWIKIIGETIREEPTEETWKRANQAVPEWDRGKINRFLYARVQFLQHCKAGKQPPPKLNENAAGDEFWRQFVKSIEEFASNPAEYVVPRYRCGYRTKVFVTFFAHDNREIMTDGTYPVAAKDQDEAFPGQTMDFLLAVVPENAAAWYVWVPK